MVGRALWIIGGAGRESSGTASRCAIQKHTSEQFDQENRCCALMYSPPQHLFLSFRPQWLPKLFAVFRATDIAIRSPSLNAERFLPRTTRCIPVELDLQGFL